MEFRRYVREEPDIDLSILAEHFTECISSTEWIVRGFTALGADIAAIVPDAR